MGLLSSLTVVPAPTRRSPAVDCSGWECDLLAFSPALTVTGSPEGGATLGGLSVVSLRGRSTLFCRRDASLAGIQSLLAVGSSTVRWGWSRCSSSPVIPVCVSIPRLCSPSTIYNVACGSLPWPQSSNGRGNSSITDRGLSGRGAALAPHPCLLVSPSGVIPRSSLRAVVHWLRPTTSSFLMSLVCMSCRGLSRLAHLFLDVVLGASPSCSASDAHP